MTPIEGVTAEQIQAALTLALQQVNAAQQGAFARAGTANDADHITRMGRERYAFEHLVGTVAFVNVVNFEFDGRGRGRRGSAVVGHGRRPGRPMNNQCLRGAR